MPRIISPDGTLAPSSLKQLRVRATEVPNVWEISLPGMLFFWKTGAERERLALIEELTAAFPMRAIGLSDWTTSDDSRSILLAPDQPLDWDEYQLKNGGWVLFFLDESSSMTPDLTTVVAKDPIDAKSALETLRKVGARAAIWSWYDDCEWLLAIDRQ